MRRRYQAAVAVTLLLLLALASPAWAAKWDSPAARPDTATKVDPAVTAALAASPGEAVPVIVYAPGHVDDVMGALSSTPDAEPLDVVKAAAAPLTAEQVDSLAELPYVTAITSDPTVFAADYASTMDVTNLTIGLGRLPAPRDGGPTGRGVTVAVIDSGIDETTDLHGSRLVGWVDFVKGKRHPYDDAGHGTFVAGLIAGDGTASLPVGQGGYATQQFRGVAPGANIVAIKVLDRYGQGRASDVIRGILWAIRHKNEYHIRVLNISAGGDIPGPISDDPLAKAVEAAWRAGIVVICAAGNEGEFGNGGILSPGNDPLAITVGALDTKQTATLDDDAVCGYSSIGPTLFDEFAKPDIVAPGNRLISLRVNGSFVDRTWPDNRIPVSLYAPTAPAWEKPAYFKLSGTSTAAPVVAGVAALMLERDPRLTPDDVKVRLMASARPLAGVSSAAQGAGAVDVPSALANPTRANGPALSADLGDGSTILPPDVLVNWAKYSWTKYSWTKYSWTKYSWTKYSWTKYSWTKYSWTKYSWTKYSWTTMIDGQ
jgi:serine protease AprX